MTDTTTHPHAEESEKKKEAKNIAVKKLSDHKAPVEGTPAEHTHAHPAHAHAAKTEHTHAEKASDVKATAEVKNDDKKGDEKKSDDKKADEKKADKKDSKKAAKALTRKKFEAVAFGRALPISKKHGMYIGAFIKQKSIDQSIAELEQVIKMKRAIPFKGEIPHRKGMMSGRYPVTAAAEFITLLKGLKGNVLTNNMNLDITRIVICESSWAARPVRRGGQTAKRTNVYIRAREHKAIGAKK